MKDYYVRYMTEEMQTEPFIATVGTFQGNSFEL